MTTKHNECVLPETDKAKELREADSEPIGPTDLEQARLLVPTLYGDIIEVPDGARIVDSGDGEGFWVQGWVWIPAP